MLFEFNLVLFLPHFCRNFVEEKLGSKYTENRQVEFSKSYEESGPETPIFFVLSPGVDPLKDVEAQGKKLGFSMDSKLVLI